MTSCWLDLTGDPLPSNKLKCTGLYIYRESELALNCNGYKACQVTHMCKGTPYKATPAASVVQACGVKGEERRVGLIGLAYT